MITLLAVFLVALGVTVICNYYLTYPCPHCQERDTTIQSEWGSSVLLVCHQCHHRWEEKY